MSDVTENLLQNRWTEYQRLLEVRASYAALVRLAEIDDVLSQEGTTWPISRKWVLIVQKETIPDEMFRKALAEAEQYVSRLKRMLSVGTNFTHEELVLAITLRVELQLLAELLLKRRGEIEFAPDWQTRICEKFLDIPRISPHSVLRRRQQRETGVFRSDLLGLNNRIKSTDSNCGDSALS